jgi:hypothetical protein
MLVGVCLDQMIYIAILHINHPWCFEFFCAVFTFAELEVFNMSPFYYACYMLAYISLRLYGIKEIHLDIK